MPYRRMGLRWHLGNIQGQARLRLRDEEMSDKYAKFMIILPSLSERQRGPILDFYDEVREERDAARTDLATLQSKYVSTPKPTLNEALPPAPCRHPGGLTQGRISGGWWCMDCQQLVEPASPPIGGAAREQG